MQTTIVIATEARQEDLAAITAPLLEHNLRSAPPPNFFHVSLLLQNNHGKTVGGLWGRGAYEWLFVEYLAVPADLRGQGLGTALLRKAEQIAREHACIGVWLDTFDFQARPFYEKLGYKVFGRLDDHPRGVSQYWLQKRLETGETGRTGEAVAPDISRPR